MPPPSFDYINNPAEIPSRLLSPFPATSTLWLLNLKTRIFLSSSAFPSTLIHHLPQTSDLDWELVKINHRETEIYVNENIQALLLPPLKRSCEKAHQIPRAAGYF